MGWLKEKARSFLRSLYHLQTKLKNGYRQFYDSIRGSWQWVHRRVAEIMTGQRIPPGHEVHHKNRDKLDNDPDNLEVLTKEEHRDIHRNERSDKIDRINKKLKPRKLENKSPIKKSKNVEKNVDNILKNIEKIKQAETNRINQLFTAFQSMGVERGGCPRCGGSGYLPQFSHVAGGVCFLCGGGGDVGYSDFEDFDSDDYFNDEDDWLDYNFDGYDGSKYYDEPLDDGHDEPFDSGYDEPLDDGHDEPLDDGYDDGYY